MDAKLAAVDEARFVFVVSGGFGARQRNHFQCPSHLPAARGARRWAAPELPSGVHSHRASLACCRSSFEHKDDDAGGHDASDAYARARPRLLLCTSRSVVLFTVDVILMATKMRSNARNEKIRLALTCLHAETTSVMREAKRKRTTATTAITLAEKFNGDEEVD